MGIYRTLLAPKKKHFTIIAKCGTHKKKKKKKHRKRKINDTIIHK